MPRTVKKFRGNDRALLRHAQAVLDRLKKHEDRQPSTLTKFFTVEPPIVFDRLLPLQNAIDAALAATKTV